MKKLLVYGMKNSIGGIENYLLNIQKYMKSDIQFVYLIEHSEKPFLHEKEILKNGGTIIYLPDRHQRGVYISELKKQLRNMKKESNVFYGNISQLSFDFIPILVAVHEGYHVITHAHGAGREPIGELLYRIRDNMFFEFGKKILKNSRIIRLAVSERSAELIYSGKPYTMISPGIEVEKYKFDGSKREHIRKSLELESNVVLGFVGRIAPVKNPLFLLEVLKETKNEGLPTKLLILGDGELRNEMEEKAKTIGLMKDILFMGSVDNVDDYLQAMDILLAPSLSEGMPLGIMEAQSAGLPSICAKGNFPEIINVTGIVYYCQLENGVEKWAHTIREIIDKSNERQETYKSVENSFINIKNSAELLFKVIKNQ